MAGRLNAATVSERERIELLHERQHLVDKELDGTITKKEANRLAYVRWSLDRIEDARHGGALDTLESFVVQYEQLVKEIDNLQSQLNERLPRTRRRK